MPVIDLAEVSAGGGSIAWIDPGGALRVGPSSAGAEPGPVCYGQGGTRPTVTDADLMLGYLNPVALLGGALPVHLDRARAAIEADIALPLGLGVLEAASGVLDVVNAGMAAALRPSLRIPSPKTAGSMIAAGLTPRLHSPTIFNTRVGTCTS